MELNGNNIRFSTYNEYCRSATAVREIAQVELEDLTVTTDKTCPITGEPLREMAPEEGVLVLYAIDRYAHARTLGARFSVRRHLLKRMLNEFTGSVTVTQESPTDYLPDDDY